MFSSFSTLCVGILFGYASYYFQSKVYRNFNVLQNDLISVFLYDETNKKNKYEVILPSLLFTNLYLFKVFYIDKFGKHEIKVYTVHDVISKTTTVIGLPFSASSLNSYSIEIEIFEYYSNKSVSVKNFANDEVITMDNLFNKKEEKKKELMEAYD